MTLAILSFGAIIIILVGLSLVTFNGLVAKRQKVRNAWSDIDVWLKRRADIIPSLTATVKAYAAHESDLLERAALKRAEILAHQSGIDEHIQAEINLSSPLAQLLLVAEDYPELKASENFLELQNALAESEEKIEMSRRYYNGVVKEYIVFSRIFPNNIIAKFFGFESGYYFDLS